MLINDILYIICDYLDVDDFWTIKGIYDLPIRSYKKIMDLHKITLNENNIQYFDELVKCELITRYQGVCYMLSTDKHKLIKILHMRCKEYQQDIICVKYKNAKIYKNCTPWFVLNCMPNIIINSYRENKFRLPVVYIDDVFMENHIELMKHLQNYPEKSNIRVVDIGHDGLWKLNYKHKLAHICLKLSNYGPPSTLIAYICIVGMIPIVANMDYSNIVKASCISLLCAIPPLISYIGRRILNLKLPL